MWGERGAFSNTLHEVVKYTQQTKRSYCIDLKDIKYDPESNKNISCGKCSCILDNPLKLGCGHIFCFKCVKLDQDQLKCVLCSKKYTHYDWTYDEDCKAIDIKINDIIVSCKKCNKDHKISDRTYIDTCTSCDEIVPNRKSFIENHLNAKCNHFVGYI